MDASQLRAWQGTHGRRLTHDLFRFPGKFHPPIVENILRVTKAKLVVDPMAGVGTTAVEAKAAGVPSISIDVDPVSVFMGRVKTTPLDIDELRDAWLELRAVLEPHARPTSEIKTRMFRDLAVHRMREALDDLGARHLEDHTHWFRRYVLADYAQIDHAIHNGGLPGRDDEMRRFFWACLLSSIRRVSLADPAPVSGVEITKHMQAKLKAGYPIDVFAEFDRKVELGIERMRDFTSLLHERGHEKTPCVIVQDDCANIASILKRQDAKPDLLLFSPPYCNAIEYWRRHRLEYLLGRFLALEQIKGFSKRFVGRLAVGANPDEMPTIGHEEVDRVLRSLTRQRREKKAWQLWHYFDDMKNRLVAFHEASPSAARCIIIVGDSRTGGHAIPTARALAHLGTQAGFELEVVTDYPIKNRVMQYPLKDGYEKIHAETIIVLRKAQLSRPADKDRATTGKTAMPSPPS